MIDVGAGDARQSRRLRRYRRPAQLFLVEPEPKRAAKLRFEFARKRSITVVQVSLGAEAETGGAADVDRLDDWNLSAPLTFLRVAVGDAWLDVLRGATDVIRRDRPLVGLELGIDPAGVDDLVSIAGDSELAIVDLFGNVVDPEAAGAVLAYQPAAILLPAEMVERGAHIRGSVRGEALRSIVNHRPGRERLKRWFGL